MAKGKSVAVALHGDLVAALEGLPDRSPERFIAAIAGWTKAHLRVLAGAADVYGLLQLSSLDVDRFPVTYSDLDPEVALARLRAVPPSSLDSLGMRIRDLLWNVLVLKTRRRCPRCGMDDVRVLLATHNGATVRMCDACGCSESEPPGWRPGEPLESMTTDELTRRGLLAPRLRAPTSASAPPSVESPEITAVLELMALVPLSDIFVEGYVDDGQGVNPKHTDRRAIRRFAPRWSAVYLEFGDTLVCFSVDEQTAGVKIARVAGFAMNQDVDPADERAVSSLSALLMALDREDVRLTSFEVFLGAPEQTQSTIFRAVGITFPHRHSMPAERYLFLDPLNLDGIAVGRREERDAWMDAAPGVVARTWSFAGGARDPLAG